MTSPILTEDQQTKVVPGLAGVAVGETAICTVGQGLGLNYRGYNIKGFQIFQKIHCFTKTKSLNYFIMFFFQNIIF
jgi:citrate synthase